MLNSGAKRIGLNEGTTGVLGDRVWVRSKIRRNPPGRRTGAACASAMRGITAGAAAAAPSVPRKRRRDHSSRTAAMTAGAHMTTPLKCAQSSTRLPPTDLSDSASIIERTAPHRRELPRLAERLDQTAFVGG